MSATAKPRTEGLASERGEAQARSARPRASEAADASPFESAKWDRRPRLASKEADG
jgi:hypothetical protein